MPATYWQVGQRIVEDEQAGQARAAYGEALLKRLAADPTGRFGGGFSRRRTGSASCSAYVRQNPPGLQLLRDCRMVITAMPGSCSGRAGSAAPAGGTRWRHRLAPHHRCCEAAGRPCGCLTSLPRVDIGNCRWPRAAAEPGPAAPRPARRRVATGKRRAEIGGGRVPGGRALRRSPWDHGAPCRIRTGDPLEGPGHFGDWPVVSGTRGFPCVDREPGGSLAPSVPGRRGSVPGD